MFYSKESIFQYLFLKAKIFFPAKKVMLHYGLTLFKVIISYVVSIFIIVYLFFVYQFSGKILTKILVLVQDAFVRFHFLFHYLIRYNFFRSSRYCFFS
ncbi:hypothetical protein BLA28_14725 [Eisenbergiella tayi]|nr:hypothetical protein BLA28_14725 [Eisenbergiella tayi]